MRYLIIFFLLLAPVAPLYAELDPLADLQAAIIQEDYKTANALAKELLKQHLPKGQVDEVQYYLGLTHLRLGEYSQSYEKFKKLLNGATAVDLYDKAAIGVIDSLYMQGQYENALRESQNLMAKRRNSEQMGLICLRAARANLKLARWNKARELLQRIISEYPDTFEAGIAQGLLEEKSYFTVQVGAFNDKARSETLMRELIAHNEYAYIVETKSPEGRKFYRVRAGQLTTLKDALELEKKLSGFGYPTLIYP